MKIGIISDTHDHIPNLKKALDLFRLQGVRTILHAGDLCSPFMVPPFEGFGLHAVFGNNDGDHYRILQKMDDVDGTHHGEFCSLVIDGRRIAMYHGTQPEITDALVKCGTYDLVISGHTHEAVTRKEAETQFVNPGSAHGFDGKATVALFDTQTQKIEIMEL